MLTEEEKQAEAIWTYCISREKILASKLWNNWIFASMGKRKQPEFKNEECTALIEKMKSSSLKQWVANTRAIGITSKQGKIAVPLRIRIFPASSTCRSIRRLGWMWLRSFASQYRMINLGRTLR